MRKLVMIVREKDAIEGVYVYQDTRPEFAINKRFSVRSSTYPLSAARWQHGEDVIKSVFRNPDNFDRY